MMRNAGRPGDGDALEVMHAARPPGAAAGLDVARVSLALVAASLTLLGALGPRVLTRRTTGGGNASRPAEPSARAAAGPGARPSS